MIRYCLYDYCEYQFEVKDVPKDSYLSCPKCGAATAAYTSGTVENEHFQELTEDNRINALETIYKKYSKCPFSFECLGYDNYKPDCEKKIFKIECLIPLHHKQNLLHHKLDKILTRLDQTPQESQ